MDRSHFRYTYENADDFGAFPTMAVCLLGRSAKFDEGEVNWPGLPTFNPMSILHGEESLYFNKPVEANKKYRIT
jgi:hypothetical protein